MLAVSGPQVRRMVIVEGEIQMVRYFLKSLVLALVAVGWFGAQTVSADEPLGVGFVYFSPVGDTGWTAEHDKGRVAMEAALGDAVTATIVENVAYGPDALRVIRQLAADGNGLIYTTSFGFMDQTLEVAGLYPDATFMHLDGYKSADNMGTYSLRYYEPSYLAGMVAGAMTTTDTIGYVSSFPLPAVLQIINGFTLGARAMNPDVVVKVIEVNSWYDPGREREASDALFAQGVDIVAHVTDSTAPTLSAQRAGKYVIGFHSDRTQFGPDSQLTAVIPVWGDFYTRVTTSVLDGTWTNAPIWDSMAQGVLAIAPIGSMVPQDVADQVAARQAEIASGAFHPFQGPISDQAGTVRVEAGAVIDESELYSMNWYVEGVEGTLPE
jgi:simple sugar transport system substrate-binding protein